MSNAKLSPAKTPKTTGNSKLLPAKERDQLLATLKTRFEANLYRHPSLQWSEVEARLKAKPEKVWSLNEMESTGGEPDVFAHRFAAGRQTIVVAEYRRTLTGGSSSNDCFVNVIVFSHATAKLQQQVKFGCDLEGSGSTVSTDGLNVVVKEGVKGDAGLKVAQLRWDGSQYVLVEHTSER